MGKCSPSSPDPSALINAQVALATLGQQTPFGSLSFEGRRRIRIPDGPDAFVPETMRVNLTPAQRQILEQQQQAALLLGQSGIGLAGQLPTAPMSPFQPGDFAAQRAAVEQAQFQRALELVRPELELQEGRLLQRLSNQGLPQASRAFESEFGRFEDARN